LNVSAGADAFIHKNFCGFMVNFLPKTRLGKGSMIFIAIFFLFFAALQILVAMGQRGGEGFPGNLLLFVPGVLAAASGVAAFFVGLFAIIRKRERGILVFISVFLGFLIIFFLFGEIIVPH
jgi:ABC-type transport system involved in multi-copper enzyme maturation permease subunit